VGGEIFCTCPDRPWGPPNLLYNGYWVFPGGKERPGRDADPSPVSSAVGHERVELYLCSPCGPYGLYRASVPVQGCTLLAYSKYGNTLGIVHDPFICGATRPNGAGPPHCRGFTNTLRCTTIGRTPLDEGSVRRRDLCLTKHNTHNRQTDIHAIQREYRDGQYTVLS